jgi:hypothetical protein
VIELGQKKGQELMRRYPSASFPDGGAGNPIYPSTAMLKYWLIRLTVQTQVWSLERILVLRLLDGNLQGLREHSPG